MAIFFLAVQTISRASGRSATAAAAYRSAERIRDERTGETFDFRRRQGVIETGLTGWSGSRSSLWNAAETAERKRNAVVARELVLALPHELSPTERRRITAEFAEWPCLRHSTAGDWALHGPPLGGDARAYHAHLMITVRRVDMDGAFGEKTRELDLRQFGRGHLEGVARALGRVVLRGSPASRIAPRSITEATLARRGRTAHRRSCHR